MARLKTLTINGVTYQVESAAVPVVNVTLPASAWVGSDNRYSQIVAVPGVTPNSQVDLKPSAEQLAIFRDKELAFVAENDGGTVRVYAIGEKPQDNYTMQVSITEVSV